LKERGKVFRKRYFVPLKLPNKTRGKKQSSIGGGRMLMKQDLMGGERNLRDKPQTPVGGWVGKNT
jgi:hypothetical protein